MSDPLPTYDVVVPTIGRPTLTRLLVALDAGALRRLSSGNACAPSSIIVVDDRVDGAGPLPVPLRTVVPIVVVGSGGRGPAAARNRGWARATSEWVVFLDDDVIPVDGWCDVLADDLASAGDDVAAVQGQVRVPLPSHRRPTDRERNVAGLAGAAWITADMAVRRNALADVGGFDERFRRAYREDTDLALRLMDAGWQLSVGTRRVEHPVTPAGWFSSVRAQRGNADDALMRRLHGRRWRQRAAAPSGALRRHVVATATLLCAVAVSLPSTSTRRRRVALLVWGAWVAQWARFSRDRIRTGPGTVGEIATMLVTSAAIPPAATYWSLTGRRRARRLAPAGSADRWSTRRPLAVLVDRDGTVVVDEPYNGDPAKVVPVPAARAALDRLRAEHVPVGMVSNQSGVAKGMISAEEVEAVHRRIADMLGPFDTVQWCPHDAHDGCGCRKPAPGLLEAAARELGVDLSSCAMIGDIGSDVAAGMAAGARAILVPTSVTRRAEVAAAPEVATDLGDAVDALLSGRRLPAGHRIATPPPGPTTADEADPTRSRAS